MQRLQLDPEEKITRKEYLKRKKMQYNKIKNRSKDPALFILVIVLLGIYLITQIYVYHKNNNYKYVASDEAKNQKVYNVYYVTEGYTYDPVYSLNLILSNGFNDSTYYSKSLLTNIQVDKNYIYGMKDNGIYRIKKDTKEMETLVEKNVWKYMIKDGKLYYITNTNKKIAYYDIEKEENKVSDVDAVLEVLADKDNIYILKKNGNNKKLVKLDLNLNEVKEIKNDINISYIIQDSSSLFFVNKSDSNYIYKIGKNGENYEKVSDIKGISDDGNIKEIDGRKYMFCRNNKLYYINSEKDNNLYSIDLKSKKNDVEISSNVEILQDIDETVYYRIKGEMGVYLYNFDTKFLSQITSRKLKEFVVDEYEQVDDKDFDYEKSNLKI